MRDEQHISILKALADETRFRLIRLIYREELSVQELCDVMQLAQPNISRHLSVLRAAQLVNDRREGNRIFYSLNQHFVDNDFQTYLKTVCETHHPDIEKLEKILLDRQVASRKFADNSAGIWDETIATLHNPTTALFALANLSSDNQVIADLGCGTGLLLPVLSKFSGKVFAIDHSEEMLSYSKERCRRLKLNNIEFICSNLESLKKKLPRCDALLLHFVLHQITNPQKIIENLKEILAKNGRFVIVDRLTHEDETAREKFGSRWLGFNQNQLKSWLSDAGFQQFSWMEFHSNDQNGQEINTFIASAYILE